MNTQLKKSQLKKLRDTISTKTIYGTLKLLQSNQHPKPFVPDANFLKKKFCFNRHSAVVEATCYKNGNESTTLRKNNGLSKNP